MNGKAKRFSGTHLHMYLVKPRSGIMVVISALDLPRTMDFSMRWLSKRGGLPLCAVKLVISREIYRPVTNADYPSLEKVAESAVKERQKFERLVVSKETLLEMFGVFLRLSTLYFICNSQNELCSTTNTRSIS